LAVGTIEDHAPGGQLIKMGRYGNLVAIAAKIHTQIVGGNEQHIHPVDAKRRRRGEGRERGRQKVNTGGESSAKSVHRWKYDDRKSVFWQEAFNFYVFPQGVCNYEIPKS